MNDTGERNWAARNNEAKSVLVKAALSICDRTAKIGWKTVCGSRAHMIKKNPSKN